MVAESSQSHPDDESRQSTMNTRLGYCTLSRLESLLWCYVLSTRKFVEKEENANERHMYVKTTLEKREKEKVKREIK